MMEKNDVFFYRKKKNNMTNEERNKYNHFREILALLLSLSRSDIGKIIFFDDDILFVQYFCHSIYVYRVIIIYVHDKSYIRL